MWSGCWATPYPPGTASESCYVYLPSMRLALADSENRDIFDSLESYEKLLTAREVARILSISEKTVYSYVSRNLIPHYKIEANVRFRARTSPTG
jgi:excisionase family DNA binding protein